MKFGKKEKKLLIVCISFLVLIIIFGIIINHKEKSKKPNIPYNTDESEIIQSAIDEIYKGYQTKDNVITYMDFKSDNIYSVLIIIKDKSNLGDYMIPTYISYNYDPTNDIIISNEKLASMYGYTLDQIHDKIETRFKTWYNDESKQGYVDNHECDFDECYLSFYRDIKSLDNYALFVKDNKLYAYIGFDINSLTDDIEYFNNLDYDYYKIEIS